MIIERLMQECGYAVKGTLVVAHPDDEALWFGGLLSTVPFEWTIVCCSIPESDPIRAWKFFDSCEILVAEPRLVPLQEAPAIMNVRESVFPIIAPILEKSDVIVTHGFEGEYGHRHHKHLSDWSRAHFPKKTVVGCYGSKPGPFRVDLNISGYEQKERAIMAYNHIAPGDNGNRKGDALLAKYGSQFDLKVETYDGPE